MNPRMRRLKAVIVKESLQIIRDPSSLLIAFVLPLILLFLFGYGVSLDAKKIRIGLVLEDNSAEIRSFAAALTQSRYFDVRIARDRQVFEHDLVAGDLRGLVIIPAYFSARLAGRNQDEGQVAPIQVITDGSQPNTAHFVENYTLGAWQAWLQQQALATGRSIEPAVAIRPRYWFNPELQSRNTLVPGSVAIIMTLIGALLTALVIAREWERGTMEAMMATPIGIFELLVGKLVPYYLLGMGSMILSVVIAVWGFDVPFRGSFVLLSLVTTTFLAAALGMGLLISTLARNQFVAGQIALLATFLPAFLLSGFIFEIPSMPQPIQLITYVLPARYFVSSLQTLFLAGDIWPVILPDMLVMTLLALVLFTLTARKTVKRLD